MAGVNLSEENARILATSSELVGTKIRSCKDESFLPPGLLHRRLLDTGQSVLQNLCVSVATPCKHLTSCRPVYPPPPFCPRPPSAKKLGVSEVPLDVVNLVSHATESRLRSLLERVSVIAQHRANGGKARTQT